MASTWRLAKSLETLRSQVNEAAPKRNKASDGAIGDTSHQASASDHNPNSQGVVCAIDITNDPKNGLDIHKVADHIRTHRNTALKYIISNSRICGADTGWKWVRYYGSNPHDKHVHFSVGRGSDGRSVPPYDSTTKWDLGIKKKVEETMVTKGWLQFLTRTINGREPTKSEKRYIGKDTVGKMAKILHSYNSYKGEKARAKKAGNFSNHLPNEFRAAQELYIKRLLAENANLKKQAGGEFEKVIGTFYRKK